MFKKLLPALALAGIMGVTSATTASAEPVTRVIARPPVVFVAPRPVFSRGWRPERRVVVVAPAYRGWYWYHGRRCWR
jgi:hypothetical protein